MVLRSVSLPGNITWSSWRPHCHLRLFHVHNPWWQKKGGWPKACLGKQLHKEYLWSFMLHLELILCAPTTMAHYWVSSMWQDDRATCPHLHTQDLVSPKWQLSVLASLASAMMYLLSSWVGTAGKPSHLGDVERSLGLLLMWLNVYQLCGRGSGYWDPIKCLWPRNSSLFK